MQGRETADGPMTARSLQWTLGRYPNSNDWKLRQSRRMICAATLPPASTAPANAALRAPRPRGAGGV